MSLDSYKKLKTDNHYAALFSPISTYRSTNVPIFSSKRNMSRSAGQLPRRCFSANDIDSPSRGNQDLVTVRQQGILKGLSSSFFDSGRSMWERLMGNGHLNPEDVQKPDGGEQSMASNVVEKRRGEPDLALTPRKKRSSVRHLTDTELLSEVSDGNDRKPLQMLQLSKDPFKWNDWQTEIPRERTEDGNLSVQYGTSLIRRNRNTRKKVYSQSLAPQSSKEEVNYLRMIFGGQYQVPEIIEKERESQLKMLREDAEPQLKRSIVDLTKKIKNILLEKTSTRYRREDGDLVILKERKVNPLEKKRQEYERRRVKFDRSMLDLDTEFKMYRKLLQERKHIQDKVREKKEVGKQRNLVPKLEQDQVALVQKMLARKDNAILSNKGNFEVTVRDFKTLTPRRWLNDTIIEFFMKEIESSSKKIVAFNSFFHTTLSERGYQGVRRWMKKKKVQISDLEKIFVPINLNQSHWALGMIDLSGRRIVYVDSLSNGPNAVSFAILSDLQSYVVNESNNAMGSDFALETLKCPQQPNGFDCGVYLCMNALYLSQNASLTFNQNDAVRMRTYIAHLVLKK